MATAPLPVLALDTRALPDLLTTEEAAAILRCERPRIRDLVRRGDLRGLRPVPRGAGKILIPRAAILEFLSRR